MLEPLALTGLGDFDRTVCTDCGVEVFADTVRNGRCVECRHALRRSAAAAAAYDDNPDVLRTFG